MKKLMATAFTVLLMSGGAALAEQSTAPVLADLLTGMQHFPSAEQKARLAEIAGDEQVDKDLRIVAGAIRNIEHQLPEAEQPALQAIVEDPASSDAAKTLARAVLGFNHKLAAQDAEALKTLEE